MPGEKNVTNWRSLHRFENTMYKYAKRTHYFFPYLEAEAKRDCRWIACTSKIPNKKEKTTF